MMARFWFLWFPAFILAGQCVLELTRDRAELAALMSENGPMELAQVSVIVLAFLVAVVTLFKLNARKRPWLFAWVFIAALASFYIAGEEVSWGQHFLNWDTPEYWKALNDQHETNLHNTSAWLDQKPRLILLIGIVVGGIIFPLLQRFRPGTLPQKFAIIYPSIQFMPLALLTIVPHLAEKLAGFFDVVLFERFSEVQEFYMFYFVLLYMIVLRRRIIATP